MMLCWHREACSLRRGIAWLIVGLLGLSVIAPTASARDIYVDNVVGRDEAEGIEGGPVRTIRRGLALAAPGDTVHLRANDEPYRESIDLLDRQGEPDRPITLNGHGATLTGADLIDPADWQHAGDGLYRCDTLYQQTSHGRHLTDDAINSVVGRYFFVFGDRVVRMGRSAKGAYVPFKEPGDLKPGEWTFVREAKGSPVFYLRIEPGTQLVDWRIAAPMRANGVAIYGQRCEHLTVRNLTVTRFYNDGVNIHGTTRDIRIENLAAIECGDDGISAHDDCHVDIDGFVSMGNSTGVCHVGQSKTTTRHMVIRDCHGVDLYLLNGSEHVIEDSVIVTDAPRAIMIAGGPSEEDVCRVTLDNVLLIRGRTGDPRVRVDKLSDVTMTQCTIRGLDLLASGNSTLAIRRSVWMGEPGPTLRILPAVVLSSAGNAFNVAEIWVGDQRFTSAGHDTFAQQFEVGGPSRWGVPKGTEAGVREDRLPKLEQ